MFIAMTLAAALLAAQAAADHQHQHAQPGSEKLGTVKFPTSCSEAAQPLFLRGMTLLHSFEFGAAIESFKAAAAADPSCGIAHWGVALSTWSNPFAAGIKPVAALQAGRDAVGKAKEAGAKTDRERAFIDAAARLYADFETVDQRTRVLAYRDAMQQVSSRFPDDPEARAFYALAVASSQDPADMTYSSLLAAGKILEELAPTQPDHPGFVHYIIHAYDAPPLAGRALDAARRYAKIAPDAPHALHMPSHTFTRLGYWQDSIDTNIASAEAARRVNVPGEEMHAMDYQTYAYLQLAQDGSAKKVLDALPDVRQRFLAPGAKSGAAPPLAAAFASAAIPARYALERGAWTEAARLQPPGSSFINAEAITWFAKAIGAARMEPKDPAAARTAITMLEQTAAKLTQTKETYWAEQVTIQRLGASAWLALAEGRNDEALSLMREAADREDKIEKNAVTPGPIAPAREQLGEMLLALNQPDAALAAFETTLKKEPNRFRALAGAVAAERRAKKGAGAASHTDAFLALTAKADGPVRPEVAAVKTGARQ
jgi:tetratricopeptide (TPR) repeat protein